MPYDPEDTLDNSNANVAVTGVVAVAPLGSELPDDADSELPAAYDHLGLIGEDGVAESNSTSTTNIKAWQKSRVVRTVVTEGEATIKFKMLETKPEVLELYFGSEFLKESGSIIFDPAETGGRKVFVVGVVDGEDFIRTIIPEGEVVEREDVTNAGGEVIGYGVTVKCYVTKPDGWPKQGAFKKIFSRLVEALPGGNQGG